MKNTIFLILLLPFLAMAEESFRYIRDNKVYKIVGMGDNQFRLWGMDQSGKEERVLFSDGKASFYTKEKLIGIFEMESPKDPYYKFGTEIPEVMDKKEFLANLNTLAGKSSEQKPSSTESDISSCQQVSECKSKEGLEAYACLYTETKRNETENKVSCRKLIKSISEKSFKQIIFDCDQEAFKYCEYKASYDLYKCLYEKKNQNYIPNQCKKAIQIAQTNLDRLTAISFPINQAVQKPNYGNFEARPIKTGFSPAGSELPRKGFPRTGIK